LQIIVRDNNIDQALKALKKKMQREGIFREMKLRAALREAEREKRARETRRSHPPLPQAPQKAHAARGVAAHEIGRTGPCGSAEGRPSPWGRAAFFVFEAPIATVRLVDSAPSTITWSRVMRCSPS